MMISGISKNSCVDYPGNLACVLFVPGCNFDCFYCHNRTLIEGKPSEIREDAVMDFLEKRSGLLDGVVITGGEPTLQRDLIPCIRRIREMGYPVKLDTNGSNPEIIEELLKEELCDTFAIDYKAPKARYAEVCGENQSAESTLETIGLLAARGVPFEVRTTVCPGLSEDDLVEMARELPEVPRYVLNTYRVPECYKPDDCTRVHNRAAGREELRAFAEAMRPFQRYVMAAE